MRPEAFLFPLRLVILMPVAGLLLGSVVGAVDLGLLAAVFLIFGLGLFELFIQKLDLPMGSVLTVESLADLKGKLGQVIVMILVVKFFEKALAFKPKEALDFLLFAGGVALLAGALWLTKAKE
jgi:uncharacterized membrane protein YqhA